MKIYITYKCEIWRPCWPSLLFFSWETRMERCRSATRRRSTSAARNVCPMVRLHGRMQQCFFFFVVVVSSPTALPPHLPFFLEASPASGMACHLPRGAGLGPPNDPTGQDEGIGNHLRSEFCLAILMLFSNMLLSPAAAAGDFVGVDTPTLSSFAAAAFGELAAGSLFAFSDIFLALLLLQNKIPLSHEVLPSAERCRGGSRPRGGAQISVMGGTPFFPISSV